MKQTACTDRQDVERLKALLQDPTYDNYEPQIVTLIGLISDGSRADIEALSTYTRSKGARIEPTMIALGTIVARHSGNDDAMVVLEDIFANGNTVAAGLGLTVSGADVGYQLLSESSGNPELSEKQRHHFALAAAENRAVAQLGYKAYKRSHYSPPSSRDNLFVEQGTAHLDFEY